MKINVKSFTAGLLTATLIGSLGFTALAATGTISLEVTPVKIMVNNQKFKPKDAQGREVLVFNHDGTVYAPLRGLADAYGLNVGWDQEKQMATVWDGVAPTAPTKTEATAEDLTGLTYDNFKKFWDFKVDEESKKTGWVKITATLIHGEKLNAITAMKNRDLMLEYMKKLASEYALAKDYYGYLVNVKFLNGNNVEIASTWSPPSGDGGGHFND